MAGQTEDQTLIGVDPGERWVGVCKLSSNRGGTVWMLGWGVIDRQQLPSLTRIADLIFFGQRVRSLACEEFRTRPVGHQAFDPGNTLQLIGALRYVAEMKRVPFHFVPAADPNRALKNMGLSFFSAQIKGRNLGHARSALRVLLHALLLRDPALFERVFYSRDWQKLPTGLNLPYTQPGIWTQL